MKLLRKIIVFIIVQVIVIETLAVAAPIDVSPSLTIQLNVGVVFYTFDDPFVTALRQSLENIEKNSQGKIKFSFYDSKNDEAVQEKNIDTLIKSENINLLMLSLVDLTNDPPKIVDKIKPKNIPVIFVNKRPGRINEKVIESYTKACYIVTDSDQGGKLQGEIIADLWNKNKAVMDKNKDNIMQYIILRGDPKIIVTTYRTQFSIMAIKDAGIKMQELASIDANWNEDTAREAVESLFMQYDGKIEAIISNDDNMAVGAVKALQNYGYNNGVDNTKVIPVFGIGLGRESDEFIKQGFITATIYIDPNDMADALVHAGINLINNKKCSDCTRYKCNYSGRVIELPFKKYDY